MEHVLTEQGLRLTYLRDPLAIDELDQERILDDLASAAPRDAPRPWFTRPRLSDYSHLILATERDSGHYLGVLGATNGITSQEEYLFLDTAFVAVRARGKNLLRRMIALAILRIGGLDAVPSIIAACTRDPTGFHVLQSLAQRIGGATFYPEAGNVAISFQTATLAQRIAREVCPNNSFFATTGAIRGGNVPYQLPLSNDPQIAGLFGQQMQPTDQMLVILDLRGADEASIFHDVRRMYRAK